ncbi:MAG: hypothetical protein HYY65_05950 [Candidatus Tectomicrobia bacterium]|uniref:EfeO-type cupredoxin-like domain-containing protein n=1 Tax=Tectimicrobiota bacterium TaxID=2528274 RepID=A0A932GP21_UNCTE|nr:hypothetical protein [Candidatus Tectomicrobia bacterium]
MLLKRNLGPHAFVIVMIIPLVFGASVGEAHEQRRGKSPVNESRAVTTPSPRQKTGTARQDIKQNDSSAAIMTINVEMTDTGFLPAFLSIPVGQRIQLVVRNRGLQEHHYHIIGLRPSNLLWLSKEDTAGTPQGEHAAHHPEGKLVPYHDCTSGVCPVELSVHAHAAPGDIDVIFFTATNTGTFQVLCPLHPEMKGKAVAF